MKATFILSILSLAASAVAGPVPALEGALEERATCPSAALVACQNACYSNAVRACANIGCNGNPSCLSACQNARRNACLNCCSSKCSTC